MSTAPIVTWDHRLRAKALSESLRLPFSPEDVARVDANRRAYEASPVGRRIAAEGAARDAARKAELEELRARATSTLAVAAALGWTPGMAPEELARRIAGARVPTLATTSAVAIETPSTAAEADDWARRAGLTHEDVARFGTEPTRAFATRSSLEEMTPEEAALRAGLDVHELQRRGRPAPAPATAHRSPPPPAAHETHELQRGGWVDTTDKPQETAADRRKAFLTAGVTEAECAAFEEQDRLEAEITEAKRLHRPTF